METVNVNSPSVFGGRISSPKFRAGLQDLDDYIGLETDIDRFKALKLVKIAGKEAGFSPELVELLEYYIIRTDEVDWQEGSQPINYQSVTTTAQDLDISERQVRNREKALHAIGALTWQDSGNFKRYGVRDRETRHIQYAFGVDLSPLASLMPFLEAKIEQKQQAKATWNETKRKISAYRARIRALIAEAELCNLDDDILFNFSEEYAAISYSIRTYHSQTDLISLLTRHKALYDGVSQALEECSVAVEKSSFSCDTSATGATEFPHIHSTTLKKSNKLDYSSHSDTGFQESVADPTEPKDEDRACGKDQQEEKSGPKYPDVTLKQILNAASSRFLEKMPMEQRPMNERDFIEAAYRLLPHLGIHKSAWGDACTNIGRLGAAICVLIIDQKQDSPENRVRNPGGYLRAMAQRAKTGELNLHGSIFGLLKRGEESHAA